MIYGKAPSGVLYAVKRSSSPVGYCSLSIRCGTRNEEGYHCGIAHFTEHTIFKGTSRKSSAVINGYLDRLGGDLNAYTAKEEIVLHSTVLKEDLHKAMSLLLELATSPVFPESEVETEKGVVIEEIRSYKDSPADDVYDKFEGMIFEGHPLERPILGTAESVKKITPAELCRFVSEKFLPESMALAVVADFDEALLEKKLLRLLEKFFPGYAPGSPVAGVKPDGPSYSLPELRIFDKSLEKRNHEVNAVFGALAPSLYEERERLSAVLLGNILAGPASNSILNGVLREKNGWVYGVETSYTQYADCGVMAILIGCERRNLDKCRKAIRRELDRLIADPLSPARLKAAKKQLLGQLAISSDNGESQCQSMGKSLLSFGKLSEDGQVRRQIEELTGEDIRMAAERIFAPEKMSALIYL